jgi:hypothetical protein
MSFKKLLDDKIMNKEQIYLHIYEEIKYNLKLILTLNSKKYKEFLEPYKFYYKELIKLKNLNLKFKISNNLNDLIIFKNFNYILINKIINYIIKNN